MAQLSRRKFLYLSTGIAIVLGAGFAVKQQVLPQLLKPENKYPQGLSIEQNVSAELLQYPPVKSNILEVTIKIRNTTPVEIESIVLEQSGLEGFTLKSARYQEMELSPKISDEGVLVFELPNVTLGPEYIRWFRLTYEGGWDSKTSNIVTQARGQYFQEGIFGYGVGHLETSSNQIQTTVQVIPLPKTLAELYQQGKQDWVKEILDRKILLQYPVPAELQERYWRDPGKENSMKVVQFLCSKMEEAGGPYRELIGELYRLPELKNPEYDTNFVKGIENIASVCLLFKAPRENIQAMLDEGVKGKRKYCTPLQALLWLGKRELWDENYNPLQNYSPRLLLQKAWNFSTNDWKDFSVVVERLNYPTAVSVYMQRLFSYSSDMVLWKQRDYWASAKEIFSKKSGDCEDHATFAAYCLAKNGYEAYGICVYFLRPYEGADGHVACVFRDNLTDQYFTIDVARNNEVNGPFKSMKEVANATATNRMWGGLNLKGFTRHKIDLASGKLNRQTG